MIAAQNTLILAPADSTIRLLQGAVETLGWNWELRTRLAYAVTKGRRDTSGVRA